MSRRHIIMNADDFGRSPGINRGVIEAFEHGIVTSASLMVRWPASAAAALYARGHARFSVGLHLDLAEWEYRNEGWVPVYQAVDASDTPALGAEIVRQLDKFECLVGSPPTHIDSHQHAHLREPALACLLEAVATRRLDVPLRGLTPSIAYCGCFYGQDEIGAHYPENVSVAALLEIFSALPAGITEIACHPAAAVDLPTTYGSERLAEFTTLCDPRVRAALAGMEIGLTSFAERRARAA